MSSLFMLSLYSPSHSPSSLGFAGKTITTLPLPSPPPQIFISVTPSGLFFTYALPRFGTRLLDGLVPPLALALAPPPRLEERPRVSQPECPDTDPDPDPELE